MTRDGPDPGLGLLLLGALALARAWVTSAPPPTPWEAGEPVPLRLEALHGEEFRLLPGVGPALAARLEAARQAAERAGARLDPADLRVPGVGPVLRAKWAALRPVESGAQPPSSPRSGVLR